MEQTKERPEFLQLCRALRKANGLRQKDVAQAIGVKENTYGNVESIPHKVISIQKVEKLSRLYELDESDTARLIAAWNELPASEYSQRQRQTWEKRNAFRSKVRGYDRIKASLVDLIGLTITIAPEPNDLCTCDTGGGFQGNPDAACELCTAMQAVGLGKWTTYADALEKLTELQDQMAPKVDPQP